MACLEYTFLDFGKKLSCLVVDITFPWIQYYCPLEAILLSIGGTFFVPEATVNFSKEMKVIGQYGIQWAIFQQILIDQWHVSLGSRVHSFSWGTLWKCLIAYLRFQKQAWEAISSGYNFYTLFFSFSIWYLILNTYEGFVGQIDLK